MFDRKVSSETITMDGDDIDVTAENVDKADPDFKNPSRPKLRGESFFCEFVNGTWLEDVLPAFDRFGIDDGATAFILGQILKVGKIDPSKVSFFI